MQERNAPTHRLSGVQFQFLRAPYLRLGKCLSQYTSCASPRCTLRGFFLFSSIIYLFKL